MTAKVRINLANPLTLSELPGIGWSHAEAIVRHRAEHGPIRDAAELARVLAPGPIPESLLELLDFAPSDDTAPEAPGA